MELEKAIKQPHFKSEYQKMLINILYTGSWLQNLHAVVFKPFGISQQQYNILRILRGQYPNPASAGLLLDRMIDKNSNVSRLVEKLRTKDLVERRESQVDRRQVEVLITETGLELLEKLDEILAGEEFQFQSITEDEARELNRILDKLRD